MSSLTASNARPLEENAPVAPRRKRRTALFSYNWPLTILMMVASLTVIIPLYFTVVMALKTPQQTGTGTGLELPSPIAWDNFSRAWEMVGFGKSLLVTALITVFSVAGAILVCSMFAYAVARNWNRRLYKITYIYVLTGLFVPFTVLILPLIKLAAALGIDSPVGVTLINIVGGIAFNSLLYIAFLRSIPVELEEAARIDGATTWQVFWRVIFPLLGPMNATVGIFAFLGAWNDFLLPQMMIADPTLQTLPVVQQLFQGEFNTEYNLAFASYLMAMVPTLIAFVFAQKWVMSGVMRGAIK